MTTTQIQRFKLTLVGIFSLIGVVLGAGCNEDTTSPAQHINLVEGNWEGTLDSANLFLTFIEGEFEGGATVNGSGNISYPPNSQVYVILGGAHNKKDDVAFGLYDVQRDTKEEFVMEGYVHGTTITGSFRQYDANGHYIKTGSWEVKRLYAD